MLFNDNQFVLFVSRREKFEPLQKSLQNNNIKKGPS